MRAVLIVLLAAACTFADQNEERRKKVPYVADAVGNTLPPPSNVPATVGSPSKLLTPDRYEFYTFDESGELVKRLMTLEEIQAIVAAGEDSEGLVTFANENQPTIAFNFSQPPYTKVHSVVTNVQNVLKAQMEAHKNKPQPTPTLDTPDVSDSWSLILPSIFGNTGVDILPDIPSGTFTTPETETIEIDRPQEINDNYLSKEGINQILKTTTTKEDIKNIVATEKLPVIDKLKENPTTASTTSTVKVSSTSATSPTITTTTTTTTTKKPTTTRPTTKKPILTSTKSVTSSTSRPRTTTVINKPVTSTTTTIKPRVNTTIAPSLSNTLVRTTQKTSTIELNITNSNQSVTSVHSNETISNKTDLNSNSASTTEDKNLFEKVNSFLPVSTVAYVATERTAAPVTARPTPMFASTTKRSVPTTKLPITTSKSKIQISTTTYKPVNTTLVYLSSTSGILTTEKDNSTTITTQSISPSTTVSSTEFMTSENLQNNNQDEKKPTTNIDESISPMFDVAQSISQIATDLGNYRPIPTTSDILDSTKIHNMDLESKESLDIDISTDTHNETVTKPTAISSPSDDKFVQISTFNPQLETTVIDSNNATGQTNEKGSTKVKPEINSTDANATSTMDPALSESMKDLLSQVANKVPSSISDKIPSDSDKILIPEDIRRNETKIDNILVQKFHGNKTTSLNYSPGVKPEVPDKIQSNQNGVNAEKVESTSKIEDNIKTSTESSKIEDKVDTEFVQISVLTNNNDSKSNITISKVNSKPELEKNRTKTNNHKTHVSQIDNVVSKPVSSLESKIEHVTTFTTKQTQKNSTTTTMRPIKPTKGPTASMSTNKISSAESNRLPDKNFKDKFSETLPKVEEFKKKIQKVNIDDKELANERNNSWKLISTVSPPKINEISKDKFKTDNFYTPENNEDKQIVLDYSKENQGLEVTTKDLGEDIAQFTELCNELAFRYWNVMVENIDKRRSFVLSPYSITSMLAMMFMGARGATSGEMNEILKLDDMVTFNPHFTLKNISDSINISPDAGVVVSAFVRELYSDRNKGRILDFYKERAQHFYSGHVEEINFKLISDIIRRRTNLLVKRHSWGRIVEYMKTNTITMQPPLAAFSTNIFQTDCSSSSVEGRDGEMYFVVSPNVRQRRLVPVPAVVYKKGFLAGYDPVLDATAAALGNTKSIVSTLFLMPGQQGNIVHAEDLEALEKRLLDSNPTTPAWNRLLRTLLPRMGLELQIPRFSHKSIFNVSTTLRKMGLKDVFDPELADLGGLNGPSKDLYLSDMIESTSFVTCGEGIIGEQHHIEEYPESLELTRRRRTSRWTGAWDEPRDYQRAFHDPHDVGDAMNLPLHLRPRQARLPSRNAQPARLKFDRPFLYFVRHNPSGMILYVGRYNPRLLP